MISTKTSRVLFHPVVVLFAFGLISSATAMFADVLVTRAGERIETLGPWTIKGKQVIFTAANGTLQALRVDDVDLEASDLATNPPEAPPPPPVVEAPPREPVLTITDKDIPRRAPGDVGRSSADALIVQLRGTHETQDIAGALDLFYRDNMSPTVTQAVRAIFDRIMAGELRNVEFRPNAAGAPAPRVDNLLVVGNMAIDIAIATDAGETVSERAVFPVAERLGSYVLVAPTTALEAPSDAPAEPDLDTRVREQPVDPEGS